MASTDPSTFIPPNVSTIEPRVAIEFCDRCRWLHRASWTSTELFLTFPPPALASITLVPLNEDSTAGRFRVWLFHRGEPALMWDRKVEGGFPELKVLKQRIRDHIKPGQSLGHSDNTKTPVESSTSEETANTTQAVVPDNTAPSCSI